MSSKSFKFNPTFTGTQTQSGPWGEWVDSTGNPVTSTVNSDGAEVPQDKVVPWFDGSVPLECAEYKRDWTHSWKIEVTMKTKKIDLNDIPIIKRFISALRGSKKFQDSEIHVLWVSHIPQNITQAQMSVQLQFTAAAPGTKNVMSVCQFPGYLYTHMIFYPGHSIELHGSPIPWALILDTTEIPLNPGYQIGDMYIRLCGKETSISRMEIERPSIMISMAPLTQQIAGVALTAPRKPSDQMLKTYVRRGINSTEKVKKMVKLMEAGVNIEGMALMDRLDIVLKKIPEDVLNKHGDPKNRKIIADKVHEAASCSRKTTFGLKM